MSAQLIEPEPTKKQSREFPTFPSVTKVEQIYIGGKATIGDEVVLSIKHPLLRFHKVSISKQVGVGDTLNSITAALAKSINTSNELREARVESWSKGTVLTIKTTYEDGFEISIRMAPQSTIVVHEVVDDKGELLENYRTTLPGATETARLGVNPSMLWYTALSGDNSAVTAVLNNRSIAFDKSDVVKQERTKAEVILLRALKCARELGVPRHIVNCLCNLGCFYYLGGDYTLADHYFKTALHEARQICVPNAPAIAEILEHGAMAARDCASHNVEDYSRAEKMYMEALQIRTSADGFYKADIAFAMMNLASLYHDWSLQAEDPSMCKIYGQRAKDLEKRIDELINPNPHPNFAARTMEKAVFEHLKACPSHIEYDPVNAWWHKIESRRLAAESYELASHMVSIDTKVLSNPPCARPFHPCLTANQGSGQLVNMVSFAEGIIAKCHEEEKTITKREIRKTKIIAGVGTILGHWTIPKEAPEKSLKDGLKGSSPPEIDSAEKIGMNGAARASQLDGVKIYLCKFPKDPDFLLQRMWRYGLEKGLSRGEIGKVNVHGWPANHKQAEQIKVLLDKEADEIGVARRLTDQEGDFEFSNVPVGDYFLYASILTKKQFRVWIIPGEPDMKIEVRRLQQFRYDFIERTGKLLWEDGHSVESQTPESYFR